MTALLDSPGIWRALLSGTACIAKANEPGPWLLFQTDDEED